MNKILARYLDNDDERENSQYEQEFDDDQYMDERKRSMFRERGGKYLPKKKIQYNKYFYFFFI